MQNKANLILWGESVLVHVHLAKQSQMPTFDRKIDALGAVTQTKMP
jgi:hypothetical protein